MPSYTTAKTFLFDWHMDITGIRPDLDEKERVATGHLQAIGREQELRRSVRQQLKLRKH